MILIELTEPSLLWSKTYYYMFLTTLQVNNRSLVRLKDNFISVTSVRFKTSSFTCTSFDSFCKYKCNIDSVRLSGPRWHIRHKHLPQQTILQRGFVSVTTDKIKASRERFGMMLNLYFGNMVSCIVVSWFWKFATSNFKPRFVPKPREFSTWA